MWTIQRLKQVWLYCQSYPIFSDLFARVTKTGSDKLILSQRKVVTSDKMYVELFSQLLRNTICSACWVSYAYVRNALVVKSSDICV